MYLTRLTLDPRGAGTRRDLANVYELHRTLTRAFVAGSDQSPARFLWRLEATGSAWSRPQVLVQSEREGDWSPLRELPNYLLNPPETKRVATDQLVSVAAQYRFRLVANPTVRRDGKRLGLSGEERQLEWLRRQGTRHGFTVKDALVSADDLLTLRRADREPITLRCVRFEGRLQAVDAGLLERALTAGIGAAKAFGCGLLSIAPLGPTS